MFIYSTLVLIVIAVISGVITQPTSGGLTPPAGGVIQTVSGVTQLPIASQSTTVTVSGGGVGVSTPPASGNSPSGGNTSVISVSPGLEPYCQNPNQLYTKFFMIADTLYFGDGHTYMSVNTADRDWKYQSPQHIHDIFANSSDLQHISTAAYFGTSAECEASGQDCSYMTIKVFDIVMVMVWISSIHAYLRFYHMGPIPMSRTNDSDFPSLPLVNGSNTAGNFLPDYSRIDSFAFDTTTQRFYVITTISSLLFVNKLNDHAKNLWKANPTNHRFWLQYRQIDDQFPAIYTQLLADKPYTAIVIKSGQIYALDDKSIPFKWHLLNISDGLRAVSDKSYSMLEFMNCKAPTKPSPLSSIISSVDNTTGGSTDGLTTLSHSPQSSKKSGTMLWILIVIIIIAIIIVVTCCMFICMKLKDDGKADNMTSKPSSAPQSTRASKTGVGGRQSSGESVTQMRSKRID